MAATTIRDVAKRAGVGVGTVSRVLNDNPLVSKPTRERVLTAIEDLNYEPSPIARRLSLGKTLTIAVMAPFFTRPSVVERLRGIEAGLADTGYDMILHNVETVARRDAYFQQLPRRERIDGLLIISLPPKDREAQHFAQANVPLVLVDAPYPEFHRVVIDDVYGGYQATRYLIKLGHRRIGFISDILENKFHFLSSQHRYEGYLMALEEAGIAYHPRYHCQGEHGRVEARRLAETLLARQPRPTAIFATSDTQAVGVLEAARRLRIAVPDQLSVIGFDDVDAAGYLQLTTVRQPLFESGLKGAELLLQIIGGSEPEQPETILPTELVVRETTGPVPDGYD
ncbi:MAG: LacI family DNA-binding transcriptional regulator [Candidatus Promineifilaceae bacterium]|nr:LacI family DNA-binding transcriptional regulator [Candidatus Promineifilaceae bacterium]